MSVELEDEKARFDTKLGPSLPSRKASHTTSSFESAQEEPSDTSHPSKASSTIGLQKSQDARNGTTDGLPPLLDASNGFCSDRPSRQAGVVFRNLTVRGKAKSDVPQATSGDLILGPVRSLLRLLSKRRESPKPKAQSRALLNSFDGCVRPGEMLLVLGRPGSGCTTLLKTLGNEHSGYEQVSGVLTYGGMDAVTFKKHHSSAAVYNPEEDLHFAVLNVNQTLDFAINNKSGAGQWNQSGMDRKTYMRSLRDTVLRLFWIEHTGKTKVGDSFVRGVSGGERKRVSIAEALVTKSSVQMWDNSTRGLDSSSALEYIRALRSLTSAAQTSTAVALYQAGEALYDAFDKVVLIDQGRCIYFGPTSAARQYFTDLGYTCPDHCTTADFLTSVTNPHERSVRSECKDSVPRTAEEFERQYRGSEIYARNLKDIGRLEAEILAESPVDHEKKEHSSKYAVPFWRQVLNCFVRQLQIIWGDKASLFGKLGALIFQSLVVGSLFYNTTDTSNGVFLRSGVIFFLLLFNTALASAETMSGFDSKPIVLKHKSFSFHRPAAYALAQLLVDMPMVLLQVLIFELVIYFLSNLARSASQWFLSVFVVWLLTMVMYSLFRGVAAIFQTPDIAMGFAGCTIQLLILYIGYIIPTSSMPPWFKWIIYVNPLQYAFEILMANEFSMQTIDCVPPSLVPYGPGTVAGSQGCGLAGSQLGSTAVSGSAYLEASAGYSYSEVWRNVGILCAFWVFNITVTLIGVERSKPNQGGASLKVYKQTSVLGGTERGATSDESVVDVERTADAVHPHSMPSQNQDGGGPVLSNGPAQGGFAFRGVNLHVPTSEGPKQLLEAVESVVHKGRLTALMGASGAGKTTLLNTLAQRYPANAVVTGEFAIHGQPLPKSFRRKVGYAEQMDLHEETSTVREALRFSALLRQPSTSSTSEKYEHCEQVISMLELQDVADAVIGTPGKGLSQETRKLVTIAVEMAARPEILFFLDEPTSGLDSAAAYNIVRVLRKLADAGQAILCTVHQPSSMLLGLFDDLLLLGPGGRCVYNGSLGPDARQMVQYFERNGAAKCPSDANSAEYMLTTIGAGDPTYSGPDWAQIWASSAERQAMADQVELVLRPKQHTEKASAATDMNAADDGEYATSFVTQVLAVVKRAFTTQWRKPEYVYAKVVLHIACALFNGFTFYKLGYGSTDMQLRLFSLFLVLAIAPPLVQALQPPFIQSRRIFETRENHVKMYSWAVWTTGAVVSELPLSIISGSLYFVTWWFCSLGFTQRASSASGYTWLMVQIYELYYLSYGQAFAAMTPNELLASLLSTPFFLFMLSFCGAFVPLNEIPTFWRAWMPKINPYHYLLEGLFAVAVQDLPVVCTASELSRFKPPAGMSCKEYAGPFTERAGGYVKTGSDGVCEICAYSSGEQYAVGIDMYYSHRWRDVGISLAFVVVNFAVVYLATWWRFHGESAKVLQRWKRLFGTAK